MKLLLTGLWGTVIGSLFAAALAGCSDAGEEDIPGFDGRIASLEEELRIDGHAEDLVTIRALAVADDGTIAFNQPQDGLVRFYGPDGAPLGSFGRTGEGPGEFQSPYRLGWHADTLWVYDGALNRITWISPSLELARSVSNVSSSAHPTADDAGEIPEFPFAFVNAVAPDGSLYVRFGRAVNQVVPERFEDRMAAGRMDVDGTIRSIMVILPPPEGGGVTSPEGGSASLPFGNSASFDIDPLLGRAVVAMASLEGPEAETFSLTTVDLEGDTLFDRRYRFQGEPIPEAVGDSTMRARIDRLEEFSPSLAAVARREATVPPLYPPLDQLLIGGDGSIWIEQREREGVQLYYVVDRDGGAVGTVELPEGGQLGEATLERIWVIETDELGVQSVVRYALTWG